MKITYFALKPVPVGGEVRQPGDLIPEAQDWLYVAGMCNDGKIAPVLVATLPPETQEMLAAWEEATYGPVAVAEAVDGPEEPDEEPDEDSDEDSVEPQTDTKKVVRSRKVTSDA